MSRNLDHFHDLTRWAVEDMRTSWASVVLIIYRAAPAQPQRGKYSDKNGQYLSHDAFSRP